MWKKVTCENLSHENYFNTREFRNIGKNVTGEKVETHVTKIQSHVNKIQLYMRKMGHV